MARQQVVDVELASILAINRDGTGRPVLASTEGKATLQGQPRVRLDDTDGLVTYLERAHLTPELDRLAPYLWLITTPSETNITPLHHQEAKKRKIVITEYPGLHLVWYYDTIFIKPIPPYMLSKAFWDFTCETNKDVWHATMGFLRTYCYLIQYEVDFRIAVEKHLLPSIEGQGAVTFEKFTEFVMQFEHVGNSQVSPRFRYGSLRLSELNYMAFFTGKLTYFHLYPQWRDYFTHLFAPIITVIAVMSIILSSMQVELAVEALAGRNPLPGFAETSRWSSVVILFFMAIFIAIFLVLAVVLFLKNQIFALRMIHRRRKAPGSETKMHSAVIG